MPIYLFECQNCGTNITKLQKSSDKCLPESDCCQDASLVKVIGATSFSLQGTGWYKDTCGSTSNLNSKKSKTVNSTVNDKSCTKSESKDTTNSTDNKQATTHSNKED